MACSKLVFPLLGRFDDQSYLYYVLLGVWKKGLRSLRECPQNPVRKLTKWLLPRVLSIRPDLVMNHDY